MQAGLVRLIHAENHPAKVHFDVYTATASVLRSIEQPGSPVNKQRIIAKGHYVSMATVIPDPTTGVWHIIKRGTGCFPSRWKSLENFIHEFREDLEIRAGICLSQFERIAVVISHRDARQTSSKVDRQALGRWRRQRIRN